MFNSMQCIVGECEEAKVSETLFYIRNVRLRDINRLAKPPSYQ